MNIPSNLSTYLDPKTFLGMTLRDYFAAASLNALLNYDLAQYSEYKQGAKLIAKAAYVVADAMINARGLK
jgi:hypothetical protein